MKWIFLSLLLLACSQKDQVFNSENQQDLSLSVVLINPTSQDTIKADSLNHYSIYQSDSIGFISALHLYSRKTKTTETASWKSLQDYYWSFNDRQLRSSNLLFFTDSSNAHLTFTIIDQLGDRFSQDFYITLYADSLNPTRQQPLGSRQPQP